MITGRAATGSPTTTSLAFDASDLMPAPMAAAFQQAILEYAADPQRLPDLLFGLDRIRQRAHR